MSGVKRRRASPPDTSPPAPRPPDSPPRLDEVIAALAVVYKARIDDGRLVVLWMEGSVEEYLGYAPEDVVGEPDFLLERLDPDDLDKVSAALESLLELGHVSLEYRVRHRDGTQRWVHDEATLVEDETGRYMVGGWTDATERAAAAAALDHRTRADKVIGRVARRFLETNERDLSAAVVEELENVGTLLGFDSGQAVLFRDGALTVDAAFEWHRQGMAAGIDMAREPRLAELPNAIALMGWETGVVAAPRVDDVFPPQAPERRFIGPGVKSLYIAPLTDAGSRVGFVGFASQTTERDLPEEDIAIVQTLAEILTGALVRRRFEALLRVSEQHLGDVTRNAHVGTWSVGLGEPFVEWSDETFRILDVDRDRAPSSDLFWQSVHPDDRERLSAARVSALASGSFACDHRLLLPDGSERYVHQTGRLVCDERERPIACTGTIQDISDRMRSERSAVDTQRLLTSFIEALGAEAFVKDRDGRYQVVNAFFETTWRVSREDVLGRDDAFVFGPEWAPKLVTDDRRIMETRTPEETEYEGVHDDGRRFVWRTHKAPMVDDRGEVVGVCGLGFDVTAQRQAEEGVRASEARLAAIVAAIPDAVTIVDRDCTVLWANEVAADLVGSDPVGRHWYEVVHGRSERCPGCDIDRALETGQAWQHEYEATTVAAGPRTLWASCSVWERDEGGRPATLLTITRDVTERKAYERSLLEVRQDLERQVAERVTEFEYSRQAALSLMQDANLERERAERALAEHETLLREVHHRVKNNLNTVANILYFQSKAIDDERARHAFEDSQDRIKSMARIHEHLYRSWNIATVDMEAYFRDLIDDLEQVHGIDELSFAVEAGGVSLDIDQAVPCGLLVNELLTNACQHAFPDGRGGHVEVRLWRDNGSYHLQVSDDGVGLPKKLDVEETQSLGLRLAGMLARQLGGDLVVDSEPGRGTAFSISFPAGDAENGR